jgi:hypothetical protein
MLVWTCYPSYKGSINSVNRRIENYPVILATQDAGIRRIMI